MSDGSGNQYFKRISYPNKTLAISIDFKEIFNHRIGSMKKVVLKNFAIFTGKHLF